MNELQFDSNEEELFFYYLQELCEAGYVDSFTYQKEFFEITDKVEYEWIKKLKTKNITQKSTLLNEHIYTPDFYIYWNVKAKGFFYNLINDKINLKNTIFIANNKTVDYSVCEIKGNFDFANMTRLWTINQKIVMKDYGVYVQKIVPIASKNKSCLFKNTFTPKAALYTKKTKQLKKYSFQTRSLEEFIELTKKGKDDKAK